MYLYHSVITYRMTENYRFRIIRLSAVIDGKPLKLTEYFTLEDFLASPTALRSVVLRLLFHLKDVL